MRESLSRIPHLNLVNHMVSLHLDQPLEMVLDVLELGVSIFSDFRCFTSHKGI